MQCSSFTGMPDPLDCKGNTTLAGVPATYKASVQEGRLLSAKLKVSRNSSLYIADAIDAKYGAGRTTTRRFAAGTFMARLRENPGMCGVVLQYDGDDGGSSSVFFGGPDVEEPRAISQNFPKGR